MLDVPAQASPDSEAELASSRVTPGARPARSGSRPSEQGRRGQKQIFADHVGIEARTQYEGVGEGGDRTLVIDRLCEDAIFAELDELTPAGHEFTADLRGARHRRFGDGAAATLVVIDPIDGSLNARRTVPLHSLSVAVAGGETMADVDDRLRLRVRRRRGVRRRRRRGRAARRQRRCGSPRATASRSSRWRRASPSARASPRRGARRPGLPGPSPGSIAISLSYVAACALRRDDLDPRLPLGGRRGRPADRARGRGHVELRGAEPLREPRWTSTPAYVAAARAPSDLATLLEAQDAVDG